MIHSGGDSLTGCHETPLNTQEIVVSSEAKGVHAITVTSSRLPGFSSRIITWGETDRDLREKILERRMRSPREPICAI